MPTYNIEVILYYTHPSRILEHLNDHSNAADQLVSSATNVIVCGYVPIYRERRKICIAWDRKQDSLKKKCLGKKIPCCVRVIQKIKLQSSQQVKLNLKRMINNILDGVLSSFRSVPKISHRAVLSYRSNVFVPFHRIPYRVVTDPFPIPPYHSLPALR